MDLLRLVASRQNLAILSALASTPGYPRELSARLGLQETHIARRLRMLEQAGLTQSGWTREDGKNVKLYRLKTRTLTVEFGARGYQVQPGLSEAVGAPLALERVPTRGTLFGRERELALLSGPAARLSMVVGLPGMGKTSLATELAHRFGIDRVVWHAFSPFDSSLQLLTLARRWLTVLVPRGRQRYETANWDLPDLLSRVTSGLSLQRALIVLDDYQKVRDDGIHQIVRHWQRSLLNARVIVLSRTRPPFDRNSTTQVVHLGGLAPASCRRLLREAGLRVDAIELRRLERAFGGHPLSLRLYAQRPGSIPKSERGFLEEMGREAFHLLDGNSQLVLLALATVRRALDLEGVRFLTSLKDPTLPLAVLERRALIRSVGTTYEVHDVLRESLAGAIASRPEIHRAASAMFQRSDREDDVLEAFYHATEAADWPTASDMIERERDRQRETPAGGLSKSGLLEILNAIEVNKLDERHKAIFHQLHAAALLGTVKTPIVIRELETARKIAAPLRDSRLLSSILAKLGECFTYVGRVDAAERVLQWNLRLMESDGELIDQAGALFKLAELCERRGNHGLEKEYWRRADQAARLAGNERLALDMATFSMAFPADWREAVPLLYRARAKFRRWGMPHQVAGIDIELGETLCRLERYRSKPNLTALRKAILRLRRGITASETLGDLFPSGYGRTWLSFALCLVGEYQEAERVAAVALEMERRTGKNHCSVLIRHVLSRIWASRGDQDRARQYAEAAVQVARQMHCGCVGITRLEKAVQEEGFSGDIGPPAMLAEIIDEILRRGYPDEASYARLVARQHGIAITPAD